MVVACGFSAYYLSTRTGALASVIPMDVTPHTVWQTPAYLPYVHPRLLPRAVLLAEQRAEEGYMAEVKRHPDGSLLLIENHCPICVAAITLAIVRMIPVTTPTPAAIPAPPISANSMIR